MQDIDHFFIKKLNNDVLLRIIYPFSMAPKPKILLRDIRSFVNDIALIENIYYTEFHPCILHTDIKNYYYNKLPCKLKINMFDSGCNERNIIFKNRRLLAIMSPEERTDFINQYILENI